ncbi:MAG: T9SS type A sorting domain-containing protein, partial [Bacteroidota bacterium]
KALVESQLNDVRQFYVFSIGDSTTVAAATDPFQVVGLYQPLEGIQPYTQQYNNVAIGYKTFSDLLSGYKADLTATAAMSLPVGIRGGAFKNAVGNNAYVLWAATTTDNSEVASGTYSFPAAMNLPAQLNQNAWDYSQTNITSVVSSQNIALTGSPVILFSPLIITALKPDTSTGVKPAAYFSVNLYPNPATNRLTIKLHLKRRETVSIKISDGAGQVVMQVADNTIYNTGDNLINVSIPSRLASGIYYCHLITGSNDQTIRFVVTK